MSSDSISDQASAWFARLQANDVSADERSRFQDWYKAQPEHAEAYDKTRKLWSLLQIPAEQVYNRLQAENPGGKSTQDYEPVQPADTAAPQLPVTGKPAPRLAVLSCLSLFLLLAGWQLPKQLQNWRSDYHTAAGQQLSVELADGSRLMLNTDTALAVRFSGSQRRIELLRGEAYFEVAPNKQRPFIVDGGDAEARAVGTAFSARKHAENLRIAVSEGIVKVSADSTSTLVRAEHQVDVETKRIQAVQQVAIDDALAWQRRQVVFNRRPLADVLDEVNRYRAGRIVAVNPALAERVLSGVFNVGNAGAVVDALQATLPVKAITLPGDLVLLY